VYQFRYSASTAQRAVVLAAMLVGILGVLAGAHASADEFQGRVIGVSDGDTLTVLHDRRPESIRLHGIDAPEKGQPFGTRARQFTASLAFGQTVVVRVRDRDRYGRTVADVILADGRNLGHEIVRAGYAWWFRRYSADHRLAAAEAEARHVQAGLWSDREPVPPWQWRRVQRTRASAGPRPPLQGQ
jgi:endonuclease YncB( thermonuclease family)